MYIIPIKGLNAIAWTFTLSALFLTIGRFGIHWQKTRRFGWDDYFNAIAVLFLFVFTITYQLYVPIEYNAQLYSLGLSDRPPTGRDIMYDMKLNYVNVTMFFCVIYSVKASFLALYWQIFEVSQGFRIAWCGLAAYTILSFLTSILATFWKCGSPGNILDTEACGSQPKQLAVNVLTMWCVLNVAGDLMLMALPIAMLRPMLMQSRQKFGLALVFALVLIIIVFDILRTVFTLKMRADFQDENAVWALLEPTIAVMVCALPCYRGYLSWETSSSSFRSLIYSISKPFSSASKVQIPSSSVSDLKNSHV